MMYKAAQAYRLRQYIAAAASPANNYMNAMATMHKMWQPRRRPALQPPMRMLSAALNTRSTILNHVNKFLMTKAPTEAGNFAPVHNINLHYLDHGGDGPVLILLHGLTANGHAFDAIAPGISPSYRVICPDLRGNGLSDKPAFCYTMDDHAQDIVGLIKHLGQKQVYLGGHSFGGYLAFYIAEKYPELVSRLIILDAAKSMNANAVNMLSGAISRLDTAYTSFDDYVAHVKKAPYIDFWDPAMVSYYRADVHDMPNGGVKPNSNIMTITEKSIGLSVIDWPGVIMRIKQPTILINALDIYTLGEPLLPEEIARETVAMMKNAQYASVDGNHLTMLYGDGAQQIIKQINNFLPAPATAEI